MPALLLSNEEITQALSLLFQRMDQIKQQCGEYFPLYSVGQSNQWQVSKSGSWLGGFWSACWWLRAHITNNAEDTNIAINYCERLSTKLSADSINRAMIFWYGAGLGAKLFDDDYAHHLCALAAKHIGSSFESTLHAIPLGRDMGGGGNGQRMISLDTLAATLKLLTATTQANLIQIAKQHVQTLSQTLLDIDHKWHAHAHYSAGAFSVNDIAGNWSRGQAWGMLGICQAAFIWKDHYLPQAEAVCQYWQNFYASSPSFPLDKLTHQQGLQDPSASLISAHALLLMHEIKPIDTHYLIHAKQQIANLLQSHFFSVTHEQDSAQPSALFWGNCMATQYPDKKDLVESPYGLFFLISCLAILAKRVKASEI